MEDLMDMLIMICFFLALNWHHDQGWESDTSRVCCQPLRNYRKTKTVFVEKNIAGQCAMSLQIAPYHQLFVSLNVHWHLVLLAPNGSQTVKDHHVSQMSLVLVWTSVKGLCLLCWNFSDKREQWRVKEHKIQTH